MRRSSVLRFTATAALLVAAPLGAQIQAGSIFRFTGVADATDVGLDGVVLDFTQTVTVARSGNPFSSSASSVSAL